MQSVDLNKDILRANCTCCGQTVHILTNWIELAGLSLKKKKERKKTANFLNIWTL